MRPHAPAPRLGERRQRGPAPTSDVIRVVSSHLSGGTLKDQFSESRSMFGQLFAALDVHPFPALGSP